MINKILVGIVAFIISLVSNILTPIETLIYTVVPDLGNAMSYLDNFINAIIGKVPWVVSILGLTPTTMSIITSLLTATVMIPLITHGIKLALKWYNVLKP